MKNKKLMRLLIGLVCMAVCVAFSGCVGDNTPTEPVTETTEPVTQAPTQAPTEEQPTEVPTEEPTEPTTEAPTEEPTEAPTEPSSGSSTPDVNTGTGGGYTPVEPEPTEPEPTEPPVIEVPAPGGETNAYFENIPASGEFSTVQIPAGEAVYYVLKTPGTYLEINDPLVELSVNGNVCQPEEGVIRVQLPADGTVSTRLQMKNIGTEDKSFGFRVMDAMGSQTNPIILNTLDFTVSLPEAQESGMYYSWTADAEGVLKLRLQGDIPGEMILTLGDTVLKLSESQDGKLQLPVKPGDTVSIQVTALPDAAGAYPAAQLNVSGYVAVYQDLTVEQIPYELDSVSVPAGKSVIYRITGAGGNVLHIHSAQAIAVYNGQTYIDDAVVSVKLNREEAVAQVEIFNMNQADQTFPLKFAYAQGHKQNPQLLTQLGEISVTVEAGTEGYYYSYTAAAPGLVSFQMWEYPTVEGCKTDITVENLTSQVSASLWSTDENGEPVEDYMAAVPVKTGDVLLIGVTVTRPEDVQAELMVYGDIYGSEENPITVQYPGFTAQVPAGETLYYSGYNMEDIIFNLTADDVAVIHDGSRYTPVEGVIQFPVVAAGRMPAVFGIENTGASDAQYSVTFTYPLGHMLNSDQLKLGTTTLTREAGKFDYYLTFTAPRTGKLTFTFDPGSQWLYAVDNLTQMVYGDTQYSDSDPLVAETQISVYAGDTVQIRVNTYDPATPWEPPAGTVEFETTYITGPTEITTLTVPTQAAMIAKESAIYTGNFYGLILNVYGDSHTLVTYNNKVYTPNADGQISVEFPASGTEKLSYTVHNSGESGLTVLMQFSTKDAGSAVNPDTLVIGTNVMIQAQNGGSDYYYSFKAEKAGTLTLTFETDTPAIYIINGRIYRYTDIAGQETYRLTMRAGQTVTIAVNTYDSANPAVSPKGTVEFTATFR